MKNQNGFVFFAVLAVSAIGSGVGLAMFELYGWAHNAVKPAPKEVVVNLTEEQVRELPHVCIQE